MIKLKLRNYFLQSQQKQSLIGHEHVSFINSVIDVVFLYKALEDWRFMVSMPK